MKINNPKSQYFIIIENAKKMNRIKMYGKTHSQKTKKLMSTQKLGENNPNYGKPRDVVTKNKISKSMVGNVNPLGIKRKRVKCPHCVVSGAKNVMVRWHFNNCKHKP